MIRFFLILIFTVGFAAVCHAQPATGSVSNKAVTNQTASAVKSSPAYAEILLQKVTLEAELEDLLVTYTETFPKVTETRFRLNIIEQALKKILAVKPSESSKLTLALGKIILQKIEFEAEYEDLRKKYKDEHPDVKRAKRKVEIFDKAIKEILP
jgi:uncharacterized protein involved in exopolysaccharide biosynthesis